MLENEPRIAPEARQTFPVKLVVAVNARLLPSGQPMVSLIVGTLEASPTTRTRCFLRRGCGEGLST
jgi:hypothetical protein